MARRRPFPVALVASLAFLVVAVVVVCGGGAYLYMLGAASRMDRNRVITLDAAIQDVTRDEQDEARLEATSEFEKHIREARHRREVSVNQINEWIAERNEIVRRRPEFGLTEMPPRTLPPLKIPKE